MTKEDLAAELNGSEYPLTIAESLKKAAKDAGLVIVYGASDDLAVLLGAIHDEIGCYEGGTFLVDAEGVLPSWDSVVDDRDEDECKKYFERKPNAKTIEAIWGKNGYSWQYKTDIPHAIFEIMEEGEIYCKGIVFEISALTTTQEAAQI